MDMKRLVIMGAGEVGRFLARSLSGSGHAVTLIDSDPAKQRMVEERLDVAFAVASVMTTTGFMTVDFDRWPELSR
jgi:Trk K+ transport system NAD-binding subunit